MQNMMWHILCLQFIMIPLLVRSNLKFYYFDNAICPNEWNFGIDFEKYYDSSDLPILNWPWSNPTSDLTNEIMKFLNKRDTADCFDFKNLQKHRSCIGKLKDIYYEHIPDTISYAAFSKILCYHVCMTMAKKNLLVQNEEFSRLCPSPCQTRSSESKIKLCERTSLSTGECIPIGTFIFTHDYECECTAKAEWDPVNKRCIRMNPCHSKSNYPCDINGTERCVYDERVMTYSCFCKPNFVGYTCSTPYNPCRHSSHGTEQIISAPVPGNRACNVNNGNKCNIIEKIHGNEKLIYYKCICDKSNWLANASIPFDNCLYKVKLCQTKLCLHGVCLSSPSGAQWMCKCNFGYTGKQCLQYSGSWSSWSNWDRCRPSCGNNRWRVRTRECSSAKSNDDSPTSLHNSGKKTSSGRIDCLGSVTEWLQCPNRLCAHAEENILVKIFHLRYLIFIASIFINVLVGLIMAFIWRLFFFGILRRQFILFIRLISKHTLITKVQEQ